MDCQGVNSRHRRPNSKRSAEKDLGRIHLLQPLGVQPQPSSSPGLKEMEGDLERHCFHATSYLSLGGVTDAKPDREREIEKY